jgi:D-lyxose ketol-isomerase
VKRSEIQAAIEWAKGFLAEGNFHLPEFAYWTFDEWKAQAGKIEALRKTMLGWDVTDYGLGDFENIGSILFTLRNGELNDSSLGTPYAEKVIILPEGQRLPMHYHANKTEDIINRGGGMLFMKLYNSLPDDEPDEANPVAVYRDGIRFELPAGEEFLVAPGGSVSLTPGLYHIFGAKRGYGSLLVGEVSSINDDNTDNHFYENVLRFTDIEEDIEISVPLCNEYGKLLGAPAPVGGES